MQTRRAGVSGISRSSAEFRSERLKFTLRSYGTWTYGCGSSARSCNGDIANLYSFSKTNKPHDLFLRPVLSQLKHSLGQGLPISREVAELTTLS
eukprot:scaffold569612_cov19-Prasinocladus_malaysianus.AAC.1